MNNEENKRQEQFEEIDLEYLKQAAFKSLDNLGFSLYKMVKSVLKRWYILLMALVLGCLTGYILGGKSNGFSVQPTVYKIMIAPQYESVDYLTRLVDANFDFDFNSQTIKKSSLQVVEGLYDFVGNDGVKAAIFGNLNSKFSSADEGVGFFATSKYYHFQEVVLEVDADFDVEVFLKELEQHVNNVSYYSERKRVGQELLLMKDSELKMSLQRLNAYLETPTFVQGLDSEKVDISGVVTAKRDLLAEIELNTLALLESDKIFFVVHYLEIGGGDIMQSKGSVLTKETLKKMVMFSGVFLCLSFVLIGVFALVRKYRLRELQ